MAAVVTTTGATGEDSFVGHVIKRASPVLTWRPLQAPRITPGALHQTAATGRSRGGTARRGVDGSRVSRQPTRRMVAWPVVKRARHGGPPAWRVALLVVGALLVGSALVLAGVRAASTQQGSGVDHPVATAPQTRPTRDFARHVADDGFDTLTVAGVVTPAAARSGPLGPTVSASPRAAAPKEPRRAEMARGRAHHGRHHGRVASH